jgi:hypothetical protein
LWISGGLRGGSVASQRPRSNELAITGNPWFSLQAEPRVLVLSAYADQRGVSTDAQNLSSQLAQLKAAGCEKVFREKITGTTADRPQLQKLMKALAPGDVVITPAVDRLSRDATDLLVKARDMQRAGAGLRSIAEPVGQK